MSTFEKISEMPVDAQTLYDWHARPGAFERLAPPWDDIEVVQKLGGIEDGARLVMKIHQGPFSVTWEALHRDLIEGEQFVDEQVRGPFAKWEHVHRFEPTEGGSLLRDHVEYELPLGWLGRLFGARKARQTLERMFTFRHRRTELDLRRHAAFQDTPRKTVAITGASGLLGSHLSSFLQTGGHTVYPVVRNQSAGAGEIYWSVDEQEIDASAFNDVDVVIHLAGENLAGDRWTDEKKRRILDSREKGTRLLTEALAKLDNPPETLLSASAVGYYGDTGDTIVDEDSTAGDTFLAEVCERWEAAAQPARDAGIRVVHPRLGVVFTPEGGALDEMLTPFKLGVGGKLGSGEQYMSWVTPDDVVGAFNFLMMRDDLDGPFNVTSPNPVTNKQFTKALGRVISRPTILPVPSFGIKMLFGEMGQEMLLEGQRAIPTRLQDAGFEFEFVGIEDALRHVMGKYG
ncbi:MAG: TIGR01777 family oxidoreductase [Myxococcota bacterium]